MPQNNFRYVTADASTQRGIFTWYMQFAWGEVTPEMRKERTSHVDPMKSPTMAGGLFAMRKVGGQGRAPHTGGRALSRPPCAHTTPSQDFFFFIGSYDMGMETWGGENLEMSFRIWMCGVSRVGRVESGRAPCFVDEPPPCRLHMHAPALRHALYPLPGSHRGAALQSRRARVSRPQPGQVQDQAARDDHCKVGCCVTCIRGPAPSLVYRFPRLLCRAHPCNAAPCTRNLNRVAEVWMDSYKDIYYLYGLCPLTAVFSGRPQSARRSRLPFTS